MSKKVFSYCRGCVSYCGLVFDVEGNDIVSHRADPEHVNSAGFKCIKADMSVEIIQGKERRFQSCMRRDETSKLVPIDQSALMDDVARIIRKSVEEYGPRSVALYIGTAGYRKTFNLSMAKQFMAAIGSESIFSTMTIDQSAHWVADGRLGIFATGKPNVQDVDLIILAGTNPVVSHGGPYAVPIPTVNQTAMLKAYRERGGKLIVIDPRKTETARAADLHIQSRPGVDTEIFAALIRIVLQNGWHDHAFCNRWVRNLDVLRKAVEPYTEAFVAERAGISADELLEAARMVGAAKKMSAAFATGTSMSPNPNTAAHVIEALNAICGGFLRAGETHQNPGVFSTKPAVESVVPPNRSWEREPKLSTGFGTFYGEFPSSRLPDEILNPSPTQIRTLIVLGANPMMAFGEPERMREALRSLDCLIVIEPRSTETTNLADYVVAPPLQYEVADIPLLVAGWAGVPYLQYTDPVIEPPAGTISEWVFFNGVANRLGHTLRLMPFSFGATLDPNAGTALTPGDNWTTEVLIDLTLQSVGTSIAELRQHPHGLLLDLPPVRVEAAATDDGARLDVCPADVAHELEAIARSIPTSTRKYRLVVRRIVELMNSEFRGSPTLTRRFGGAAPLYMHPEDMAEEGLASGALVAVNGEHGRISARVRPDKTTRRGIVSMPHCWNGTSEAAPASGHTSNLVSMAVADVQSIDAMPQQSSLAVDILPA